MSLFCRLEFQLNIKKSTLIPIQQIDFTRASLDAVIARAYLLVYRFMTLTNLVSKTQISPQMSARNYLQLLGISETQHASLRLCYFQGQLRTVNIPNRHSLGKLVSVPH